MAYCRKNQLHSLCDKISLIIDKKRRIEEYRDPVHDELDNGSTFDENDTLEIIETATSSKYGDSLCVWYLCYLNHFYNNIVDPH